MSFSKTTAANVDILLTAGTIYNVTAEKINKKFEVKRGKCMSLAFPNHRRFTDFPPLLASDLAGTLYYDDVGDLSDSQVARTGTEDDKLVVFFVKNDTKKVAKVSLIQCHYHELLNNGLINPSL